MADHGSLMHYALFSNSTLYDHRSGKNPMHLENYALRCYAIMAIQLYDLLGYSNYGSGNFTHELGQLAPMHLPPSHIKVMLTAPKKICIVPTIRHRVDRRQNPGLE